MRSMRGPGKTSPTSSKGGRPKESPRIRPHRGRSSANIGRWTRPRQQTPALSLRQKLSDPPPPPCGLPAHFFRPLFDPLSRPPKHGPPHAHNASSNSARSGPFPSGSSRDSWDLLSHMCPSATVDIASAKFGCAATDVGMVSTNLLRHVEQKMKAVPTKRGRFSNKVGPMSTEFGVPFVHFGACSAKFGPIRPEFGAAHVTLMRRSRLAHVSHAAHVPLTCGSSARGRFA